MSAAPAARLLSRIFTQTPARSTTLSQPLVYQRTAIKAMDQAQPSRQKSKPHRRPKRSQKPPNLTSGTPNAPDHSWNQGSTQPPVASGSSAEMHPPFVWREFITHGTTIQYLRDAEATNTALQSARGPFGFDIEWKANFIKGRPESPIALIQLARPDEVFLIQAEFPEKLRDVLEDREIVKAGVGVSGDAAKLWRDFGVSLLTAVELSHFARAADPPQWESNNRGKQIGLARLLETYKSRRLVKAKRVQLSNWEAPLNARQLDYATSDALAGFTIYQHLLDLESGVPVQNYTHNYLAGQHQPYVCPDPIVNQQKRVTAASNP